MFNMPYDILIINDNYNTGDTDLQVSNLSSLKLCDKHKEGILVCGSTSWLTKDECPIERARGKFYG